MPKELKTTSDKPCFFCGAGCPPDFLTKDYLSPAFNAGRIVAAPDSDFICASCVWFLQEKAIINLANAGERENQKVRSYSWVIAGDGRVAYTKAHLPQLQAICLEPPAPPFKILLADSGQKHLFYRSEFNLSSERFVVQLEETAVFVEPRNLKSLLEITSAIAAAVGKGFLTRPPSVIFAVKLLEKLPTLGESLFEQWQTVYPQPLARLAAWLTFTNKEN